MTRTLRATAGFLIGLVAGVVLTMSVVVFRKVAMHVYLHGLGDLLGWISLPALLLPFLGLWAALSRRVRHFWTIVAGCFLGIAAGALVGTGVGAALGASPAAPWSAGILGAGTGVVLGAGGAALFVSRDPDRVSGPWTGLAGVLAAAATAVLLVGGSVFPEPVPEPPGPSLPEPAPGEVESVLFLVGDAGGPPDAVYPVLQKAATEVERWSDALSRDSSVAALFLGDVVYPDGLHAADHSAREGDSLRILSQIGLLAGASAREIGARGLFVVGNHDWGREQDWEGAVRVHRLRDFLSAWEEEEGVPLRLAPEPGTGGPEIVDVGAHLRLVLLDTAWWLLDADPLERREVLDGVEEALRTRGGREVVIAAHHPFASGGPHGHRTFGRSVGIGFLLARAGAVLQDLSSEPYEELRSGLTRIFGREGRPDLFVGGHEHSLQIFRGSEAGEPLLSAVVGSAAKLTGVEGAPDMVTGLSAPGYGKLFVLEDGGLRLVIEATEPGYLRCPADGDPGCLEAALDSFRTVWSGRPEPADTLGPSRP